MALYNIDINNKLLISVIKEKKQCRGMFGDDGVSDLRKRGLVMLTSELDALTVPQHTLSPTLGTCKQFASNWPWSKYEIRKKGRF